MLSVHDARTQLLAALPQLTAEQVHLQNAVGRVLARPLTAGFSLPPFDNSSMDGFAVRAADISSAGSDTPVMLTVVDDIPAGAVSNAVVKEGQAARIMTGAPLPEGADAVVPVEHTDFNDRSAGSAPPATVNIRASVTFGGYIRRRGEDVAHGDELLPAGHRLRPQDVGMAAMTGLAVLEVVSQPRIAVLSTGDELLFPGEAPEPGKIYESNSLTISALVESMGAEAIRLGIARDRESDVRAKLDGAVADNVDLIISTAGVSVGAYDYVKDVVESAGTLGFWRVNMRPGKPLAFGEYRDVPFVGLPGNPVSSFVGFEVFLRPAIAKMSGWTAWTREVHTGRLGEPVESDGRESYLRAVVRKDGNDWIADLTGHQGSGNQFSLVRANALIIIPAGVRFMAAGSEVKIWNLS